MLPIDQDFSDSSYANTVLDDGSVARLVELADHCTAAKKIADDQNQSFLSYMLAMTIQAVHMEMRPNALRRHRVATSTKD